MANKDLNKDPRELTILVPGGAGYIGSHTCVELLERGYRVVVVDNLSNSSKIAIDRIRELTQATEDQLVFYEADILDREKMHEVFNAHDIDAIIMFAGLKAVGESTQKPLEYYWNNVGGALVLFEVARDHGCKNVIFSSSATVYGAEAEVPYTEACKRGTTTNPYGETKAMIERMLTDFYLADDEWNVVLLRYFNPIGAHISGRIGEDPQGIPNNLLPYVSQVAVGKLKELGVFGDDYPTPDGTGVRDYIHVVDLAIGHVKTLDWMAGKIGTGAPIGTGSYQGPLSADGTRHGVGIFNLGTGKGSSVLEVVHAFEEACGHKVPYAIKERRPGDLAEVYASCEKAKSELGWVAQYDLKRMCEDTWRWQSNNPNGYEG